MLSELAAAVRALAIRHGATSFAMCRRPAGAAQDDLLRAAAMKTGVEKFDGIGMTSARTRARMVERMREQGIRDESVLSEA